MVYPSALFFHLGNSDSFVLFVIIMYGTMIAGIYLFSIYKPCSIKALMIGAVIFPLSFLAYGMVTEYINYQSFPETFMYGVPFTIILLVSYTCPYIIACYRIDSGKNKTESPKDTSQD